MMTRNNKKFKNYFLSKYLINKKILINNFNKLNILKRRSPKVILIYTRRIFFYERNYCYHRKIQQQLNVNELDGYRGT